MSDHKLKPCPSCLATEGALGPYISVGTSTSMGCVVCLGCGLHGPVSYEIEETVALWNAMPRREEWRSVIDDPPEDGAHVWGHRPNGSITEAYQVVWFDEGEAMYNKEPEDGFDLPITHWLPIPPPPRVPSLGLNEIRRKKEY